MWNRRVDATATIMRHGARHGPQHRQSDDAQFYVDGLIACLHRATVISIHFYSVAELNGFPKRRSNLCSYQSERHPKKKMARQNHFFDCGKAERDGLARAKYNIFCLFNERRDQSVCASCPLEKSIFRCRRRRLYRSHHTHTHTHGREQIIRNIRNDFYSTHSKAKQRIVSVMATETTAAMQQQQPPSNGWKMLRLFSGLCSWRSFHSRVSARRSMCASFRI